MQEQLDFAQIFMWLFVAAIYFLFSNKKKIPKPQETVVEKKRENIKPQPQAHKIIPTTPKPLQIVEENEEEESDDLEKMIIHSEIFKTPYIDR